MITKLARKCLNCLGHARIDVTYKYVPKGYENNMD